MSRFIGVRTLKTRLHDVLKSEKPLARYVIIVFCSLQQSTRVRTATRRKVLPVRSYRTRLKWNLVLIFCLSAQCFARFRRRRVYISVERNRHTSVRVCYDAQRDDCVGISGQSGLGFPDHGLVADVFENHLTFFR